MLTKTRQSTRFFVRNRFLNSSPKSELGEGGGRAERKRGRLGAIPHGHSAQRVTMGTMGTL